MGPFWDYFYNFLIQKHENHIYLIFRFVCLVAVFVYLARDRVGGWGISLGIWYIYIYIDIYIYIYVYDNLYMMFTIFLVWKVIYCVFAISYMIIHYLIYIYLYVHLFIYIYLFIPSSTALGPCAQIVRRHLCLFSQKSYRSLLRWAPSYGHFTVAIEWWSRCRCYTIGIQMSAMPHQYISK